MNVENINKLATALEKVEWLGGQLFDMGDWGTNMWHNVLGSMGIRLDGVEIQGITLDDKITHCGTTGCIAGWAILVLGDGSLGTHGSSDYATDLLGLEDRDVANSLFTPASYDLDELGYPDITAGMAAEVLRDLAKTGEVNWSIVSWASDDDEEEDVEDLIDYDVGESEDEE